MSIEKFGVQLIAPESNITLKGQSFAELILLDYLHVENLRRCAVAMSLANPNGENELLADIHVQLQVMIEATDGRLQEMLRVGGAQGLHFKMLSEQGEPNVETRAMRRNRGGAAPARH